MLPINEIPTGLAEEFAAGVRWLQDHGRPELTIVAAVAEALEDWIAAVRAEHLRGGPIPTADTASGGRSDP